MKSIWLAVVMARREARYVLFVVLGVAFLGYVAIGVADYSARVSEKRRLLQAIDADVIAPKGSSVEHLRRFLRLEKFKEPALLPKQLWETISSTAPKELKLVPVFFWGQFEGSPVIATNAEMQNLLVTEFSEIDTLADDEVIVGRNAANLHNLREGSIIGIRTELGSQVTVNALRTMTVKKIANLAAWDDAILTSYYKSESVLKSLDFQKSQIWSDKILSYIFVTGPDDLKRQVEELVDKRTVAVYLKLKDEVPSMLSLTGVNQTLEIKILFFAFLAASFSVGAFLAVWIPTLRVLNGKLRRSGWSSASILTSYGLLNFLMVTVALIISITATQFWPIL